MVEVGFGWVWGVVVDILIGPSGFMSPGFLGIHGIYLTTVKDEHPFRKVTMEINSNTYSYV